MFINVSSSVQLDLKPVGRAVTECLSPRCLSSSPFTPETNWHSSRIERMYSRCISGPHSHRTRSSSQHAHANYGTLQYMGVFTQVASNIKGFARYANFHLGVQCERGPSNSTTRFGTIPNLSPYRWISLQSKTTNSLLALIPTILKITLLSLCVNLLT